MAESCPFEPAGAWVAVALAAVLGLIWLAFIINARFGLIPLYIARIINDRSFLLEYERRQEKVVLHELHKRYKVGNKLGEGVTAAVYRIQERSTGTYFALKQIRLKGSSSLQRAVERELRVLKKLRHHHVCMLHDTYHSPRTVWAVLEFVSGGELTHYITMTDMAWNESLAIRCTHQVVAGLAYLHSQGVCHRDIKLANLLRSSKSSSFQMKIADFGAAAVFAVPEDCATLGEAGDENPGHVAFKRINAGREAIGTPCNMAPEVFDRAYGPMCDMWSFGCVLYELLLGEPPFDPYKLPHDDPEYHLKRNVRGGRYPTDKLAAWKEISPLSQLMIQQLLSVSPRDRLSAFQALHQPWMKLRHTSDASRTSSLEAARKSMQERRKTVRTMGSAADTVATKLTHSIFPAVIPNASGNDEEISRPASAPAPETLVVALQPKRQPSEIHGGMGAGLSESVGESSEGLPTADRISAVSHFPYGDGIDVETAEASIEASASLEDMSAISPRATSNTHVAVVVRSS